MNTHPQIAVDISYSDQRKLRITCRGFGFGGRQAGLIAHAALLKTFHKHQIDDSIDDRGAVIVRLDGTIDVTCIHESVASNLRDDIVGLHALPFYIEAALRMFGIDKVTSA